MTEARKLAEPIWRFPADLYHPVRRALEEIEAAFATARREARGQMREEAALVALRVPDGIAQRLCKEALAEYCQARHDAWEAIRALPADPAPPEDKPSRAKKPPAGND